MNKDDAIIDALAQRFLPGYQSLATIRSGRNTVVDIKKDPAAFILKAVDINSAHGKNLANEAEWVHYLSRNNICVPSLVRSNSGNLVETTGNGDNSLIAYCYEKMAVETDPHYWQDPSFIQQLGRTMGEMHRLAASYDNAEQNSTPSWDSDGYFSNPASLIHPSQSGVIRAIEKLKEQLSSFQKDRTNFGLIHDDLHAGNVFKSGDRVAVLDFECLHRSWFLADISSTLLFVVWIGPSKSKPETKGKAAHFLRNLLAGYTQVHELDESWHELIPLFLRLREIRLFTSMFSGLDVNRNPDKALFQYVYRSISENTPFLDIDFKNIV